MVTKKNTQNSENELISAGHRLGQIVGDWWETQVIYPLLLEVAKSLNLYLDNRVVQRDCRSAKVQWEDADGNNVDYDYVLEIGGTSEKKGVPVAFLESFWRGEARHSKDKARDDTTKLLPMRGKYPTARFLAIAACGEFTAPAREYVRSRDVELFFVSKSNIIKAFAEHGLNIDYADSLPEDEKNKLAQNLERNFTDAAKINTAKSLRKIAGANAFSAFKQLIIASLCATPQEIRIYALQKSEPAIFKTLDEASAFLNSKALVFSPSVDVRQYEYEVVFSDCTDFGLSLNSLADVIDVNSQLLTLVKHMQSIKQR
jgi:hypothetical protein